MYAITVADIDKFLHPKPDVDRKDVLPPDFFEFLDVFHKKITDRLPKHRGKLDHTIPLIDGAPLPHVNPRPMGYQELLVLRAWLDENLGR